MNTGRKILATLAVLAVAAAPLAAQQKPKTTTHHVASATRHVAKKTAAKAAAPAAAEKYPAVMQERPGLMERAKVTADAATETALKDVAGATVVSRRLVERGPNLVYVIRLKPKTGATREVNVDATTGAVVPMTRAKPKGS
jgi:uncharacterized membrane protein YkoI